MLLDLNDPKSIVAWWEVFPERHGPLLANWAQRRPEVRGAIALASQMIRANPRTAVMLREAELRRAANEVAQVPPSHDEQLAREDGALVAEEVAGQDVRDQWDHWDDLDARDREGSSEEEAAQELEAMAC